MGNKKERGLRLWKSKSEMRKIRRLRGCGYHLTVGKTIGS